MDLCSQGSLKPAPHFVLICTELLLAAAGFTPRLLLQAPVGHGKSTLASVFFPFWYILTFPDRKIVILSHTDTLAQKWARRVRDLVERWGPELAGLTIRPDKRAADNWEVITVDGKPTGGEFTSAGRKGAILGSRADCLLADDIIKSDEEAYSETYREATWEWWKSVAETRLKPHNACSIVIGHPWHSDDLHARLLRTAEQGGQPWKLIKLPALSHGDGDPLGRPEGEPLWPGEWSKAALEAKREDYKASGELRFWAALYDLTPIMGSGASTWPDAYFSRADLWYDELPYPVGSDQWQRFVLAIDTSRGKKASDWQALVLTRLDKYGHFWISSEFCRLDDAQLITLVIGLIETWAVDITIVEVNSLGWSLMQALARTKVRGVYPPILGRDHTSKERKQQRIEVRLTSQLARGTCHFERSPGNRILISQLRQFPNDRDDGPDAMELSMESQGELLKQPASRVVKYTIPSQIMSEIGQTY